MSEVENCSGNCDSCAEAECERGATITLNLDNDEVVECSILTIYETCGKEYIALLPQNEDGERGEVYLYRCVKDANGVPALENIIDDEEYEMASEGFDEWLDGLEYDDLVEYDEEGDDEA